MSNLSTMPIASYRKKYGLMAMVETGTEGGFGISVALRAGFEWIYSCEIVFGLYKESKEKYGSENVHLFHGSSLEMLPEMLDYVDGYNVLFWLDAHLPKGIKCSKEDELPLQSELQIITENRDCDRDVFLIDDIYLYDERFIGEILTLFPNHISEMVNDTESDKTLALFPLEVEEGKE